MDKIRTHGSRCHSLTKYNNDKGSHHVARIPARRWYNEKDYEHNQRKYNIEFNKKKKAILEADSKSSQRITQTKQIEQIEHQNFHVSHPICSSPSPLYSKYTTERHRREVEIQEKKWEIMLDLYFFLRNHSPCNQLLRIVNQTLIIYDIFFEYEPKQFISRTNFRRCIDDLMEEQNLGDIQHQHEQKYKQQEQMQRKHLWKKIHHHLNHIFDAFDVFNDNKIDWRQFCYMLHICCSATFTFEEFIVLGFRYYSAHNNTMILQSDKINFHDIVFIFHPLLLHPLHEHRNVMQIVHNAWIEVCFDDKEANRISMVSEGNASKLSTIGISLRLFQLIIKQQCFQDLLQSKTTSYFVKNSRKLNSTITSPFENK